MKRLLRYLKNYKIQCVLAPLFKMLEALFELFVPLVIAALIDRISDYSASGDAGFVVRCFVLLIILGVVGLISSCTAQFFAARAAVGFSSKLRVALFEKIQGFSYTQLDNIGTGTLITKMTDCFKRTGTS